MAPPMRRDLGQLLLRKESSQTLVGLGRYGGNEIRNSMGRTEACELLQGRCHRHRIVVPKPQAGCLPGLLPARQPSLQESPLPGPAVAHPAPPWLTGTTAARVSPMIADAMARLRCWRTKRLAAAPMILRALASSSS